MDKSEGGNGSGWCTWAYPYLLAVSFPLSMWLNNLSEDPLLLHVSITFGIALLFAAGADWTFRWLMPEAARRALWVSLLVAASFGYGHAFGVVDGLASMHHRHFAPLWLGSIGLGGLGIFVVCRRNLAAAVSRWAGATVVVLVVAQLVWATPVLCAQWRRADADAPEVSHRIRATDQASSGPATRRPDIYYIILDGYARHDVLRELYGFDNQEFLDTLRSRGFFIASRARSNYAQTRLSLASSLSMEYLPEFPAGASYDLYHQEIRARRKNSRVVGRLRELGYRYRYVGSIYFPVDAAADEELFPEGADCGYVAGFLATTVFDLPRKLLRFCEFGPDPVKISEYQFENLAKAKADPGPLFTFVHIACPHEPYVYDRSGPLPRAVSGKEATPAHYIEQLRYLNGRVLEFLDAIDRTSGPDAVVVLQADHGSDLLGMPERPTAQQLRERMAIFSAYRLPPGVERRLYDSITPVNSFRVIFSGLFGDRLALLEDRSYYSPYDAPFGFVEYVPDAGRGSPSSAALAQRRSAARTR
jgi:hypothetical protein